MLTSKLMQNKNILITGANGQLGSCLRDLSKIKPHSDNNFLFTDVDDLDITIESAVEKVVANGKIDIIINAAAYTAVDKAEDDVEKAYLLNRDAVGNLARVASKHDALLVHISTDYIFSGNEGIPHREDDETCPLSVYGASKLAGEREIVKADCNAIVIRTSWLYSEYGNNFVKTMLRLGSDRDEINVVCDQIGGPTYAGDLAKFIFLLIEEKDINEKVEFFHFANEGVCSWYDFSKAIMEFSEKRCKINPILTSEYPVRAHRPSFSVFNLSKIKKHTGVAIPYWRDSLSLIINKLENR